MLRQPLLYWLPKHPVFWFNLTLTQSVRLPMVTYLLLCSTCVTYGTPCHARFLDPFYTFSPANHRLICDTFILTFYVFHFYRECYGFEWGFFAHGFTLYSFVCDSDEGRSTPSRILLCFCPHRVVSFSWRMDLNYWCLNYKIIDLSIAPVSHEI